MTRRRQSNARPPRRVIRLPVINPAVPLRIFLIALGAGIGLYALYGLIDVPVRSITIAAPFERVSAMQVEAAVREQMRGGFLSSDLDAIQARVAELPWVDRVRVRRRWPAKLAVTLSEQVAAARWNETGLLNTRGELFIENARHLPPELPRLAGPDGSEWRLAQRYLQLHGPLLERGLQLDLLALDERGALRMVLTGGIEIRLGREATDARLERFLQRVTPLISTRLSELRYVDMRYSNGFALSWAVPETPPPAADGQLHAAIEGVDRISSDTEGVRQVRSRRSD